MSTNAAFADRVPGLPGVVTDGVHAGSVHAGGVHAGSVYTGGVPSGGVVTDGVEVSQTAPPQTAPSQAVTSQAAASQTAELERWYTQRRRWPVERDARGVLCLSAGTDFDVVEVPEEAGRDALRRLIGYDQAALAPGPVALTGADRCGFFVTPGSRDDLPELLDWLDWGGIELGLRAYGAGDRIPAPGRNRWLHDPLAVPPEVIALLATIAESCSRYALTRRAAERGPASSN